MRHSKVWGGLVIGTRTDGGYGQVRAVVKARSQKDAVEALCNAGYPVSLHHFRNYWAITGNKEELDAVALKPVGSVQLMTVGTEMEG